jgi:hypothetical protein
VALAALGQSAERVHTVLRRPELTDPPGLAVAPLDWLLPAIDGLLRSVA